jgi:hypothetical protein
MLKLLLRKSVPHLIALLGFLIITLTYFSPLLEGKRLLQGDIVQFRGMAQEIVEFREETGEEALWTNSMFGGMPAYLISVKFPYKLIRYVDKILSLGLPVPGKFLFLSLVGFYILLLAFRVDPWLSIAGALAFGFSTYFFIIEVAGHNTKAHAMSYMAPLIAGIILSFRGKLLLGCVLTGVFLALQLYTNHLQITYYTLLIVMVFGIYELVNAIKNKLLPEFTRNLLILLIPVILAVGANFTNMYLVWEYGRYSTRGASELTIGEEVRTSGLDKNYILDDYSYGIAETMNLLIPNFKGGASSYDAGTDSEVYSVLVEQGVQGAREIASGVPAYWGTQRFTSGPVYIGASVIFFFVIGLFVVGGRYKWWILTATILSITLAWGKNFLFLSELFIHYFPGYNRFRTVSMILVIAQLTIPLLAVLGLKEIFAKGPSASFKTALKRSYFVVGGVTLFFALLPGMLLSFSGPVDSQLLAGGWPEFLVDALQMDRESLLRADAFRSFIFISLGGGLIWLFLAGKVPVKWIAPVVAIIIIADLWPVNRRFLDDDNFVTPRRLSQPFQLSEADVMILADDDPHYRVFNLTRDPFNDAITSYHHKSLGGYHGAKMGRYQDVISHHLVRNNIDVVNMLNTRYIIRPGENGQPQPFRNPGALGNAWFVEDYRIVENADQEILALHDFDPAREVIIDQRFEEHVRHVAGYPGNGNGHSGSEIELTYYSPNHLVYRSNAESPGIVVFSEIYYDAGWEAFINGEAADHFRANYILRAMVVPAGENEIEFRFMPRGYFVGEVISLASSILLLLLAGSILWKELKSYAEISRTETI